MKTLLLMLPAAALLGTLACNDRDTDRDDLPRTERIEGVPAPLTPTNDPARVPGRGEGERESLDWTGMPTTMTPSASSPASGSFDGDVDSTDGTNGTEGMNGMEGVDGAMDGELAEPARPSEDQAEGSDFEALEGTDTLDDGDELDTNTGHDSAP